MVGGQSCSYLVVIGPSYAQPAKSMVLATFVLVTVALRSTSIPSNLADDEKKLLPEVMMKSTHISFALAPPSSNYIYMCVLLSSANCGPETYSLVVRRHVHLFEQARSTAKASVFIP